ncbi:unnamed protein product [Bursaphelenchus okinawaensis]|uniref:Uncharacterized protein n=1 Tax=Bursaphelenchus okinawaensis TaxID=465554 RepID=A0A811JQ40_9BILA|nr:unnamed protein product [Bursaphelenchus okinawaensis]CAG9077163.1 unnamed protein product [Bursaphelenchus okinawaensis]
MDGVKICFVMTLAILTCWCFGPITFTVPYRTENERIFVFTVTNTSFWFRLYTEDGDIPFHVEFDYYVHQIRINYKRSYETHFDPDHVIIKPFDEWAGYFTLKMNYGTDDIIWFSVNGNDEIQYILGIDSGSVMPRWEAETYEKRDCGYSTRIAKHNVAQAQAKTKTKTKAKTKAKTNA